MATPKIAFVALCGLPASGKTSLCIQLNKFALKFWPDISIIHINFDDLFERRGVNWNYVEANFKRERSHARAYIKRLLELLSLNGSCTTADQALDVKFSQLIESINCPEIPNKLNRSFVFLLDDNMYYNSMRYAYCQIAREAKAGFGTLFIKCALDTSLERNSIREPTNSRIPSDVVLKMHERFEEPDSSKRNWEQQIFTVYSERFNFDNYSEKLRSFLLEILANPLIDSSKAIKEQEELDNQLKSIAANNSNVVHNADLMIRKAINEILKSISNDDSNQCDLPRVRRDLLDFKKMLLDDIRRKKYCDIDLCNHDIVRTHLLRHIKLLK